MGFHLRKTVPAALVLLRVLLLLSSAACLALAFSLPAAFDRTVSDSFSRYPLAFPDAVIETRVLPDKIDRNAVSTVGHGTVGAALPRTIGGRSVLLVGLPESAFSSAFPTEEDKERSGPAGAFCTVLPLSKNSFSAGDVLTVPDSVLSADTLTITAETENPLSIFSALLHEQENTYDCILYTDLSAWTEDAAEENARIFVEFGSSHKNDPKKAAAQLTSAAETTLSGRKTRYRARLAKEADALAAEQAAEQTAKQAAELLTANSAEAEALKKQISALDAVLTALEKTVPEAEQAFLSADSALEKARQAFNSDMEYAEYHAANQTGLVEAKEAAEAEFAVMQADADQKLKRLNELYAERLAAQEERQTAVAALAALADAALPEQTLSVGAVPAVTEDDVRWTLFFASDDPLFASLRTFGQKQARPFLYTGVFLLLLTAVFGFLLRYQYRRPRGVLLFLPVCLTLLGCAIGILSGGTYLLIKAFPRVYGASLPVPETLFSAFSALPVLLLLLFPLFCGAAGMLLRASRLRAIKNRQKTQS